MSVAKSRKPESGKSQSMSCYTPKIVKRSGKRFDGKVRYGTR